MSSREKELEIVEAATPGPWEYCGDYIGIRQTIGDATRVGPTTYELAGVVPGEHVRPEDAEFIATFNPARVRELLDENHEVTRLLAERDVALNYANKHIHRLEARLDAVERLHYPVEIEPSDTICGRCSHQLPNGKYLGKIVEWPCDNIKAVRGE